MTGIVNSTGARSGVIGTIVGTPTSTVDAGHPINVQINEYDGGAGSNQTSYGELSTNIRFSYTPISAGSKMIVSYQGTNSYIASTSTASYYGIGHEVTESDGTATPANFVSGRITVSGGTADADHFQFAIGDHTIYKPLYIEVAHSPSYTLGQKIWYSIISKASAWHYFSNGGDIRFKAIEVKG